MDNVCSMRGKYEGPGGGPGWSTVSSKKTSSASFAASANCWCLVSRDDINSALAAAERSEPEACLMSDTVSFNPLNNAGAQADGSCIEKILLASSTCFCKETSAGRKNGTLDSSPPSREASPTIDVSMPVKKSSSCAVGL